MSNLVPTGDIERIVGAPRHPTLHQARAVSAEQTVYILHSQECLDSGVDFRECRYSLALDNGIRPREWVEDVPTVAGIRGAPEHPRLVPENMRVERLPEMLCDDCSDGDHEACRREGGWMHQDTAERCSCHLTDHALDPRRRE